MKVLYDANVLLDVFQYREPFYEASVLALNASMNHLVVGYFPAHAVPIISYVLRRHADKETAALAVNWLLDTFENRSLRWPRTSGCGRFNVQGFRRCHCRLLGTSVFMRRHRNS